MKSILTILLVGLIAALVFIALIFIPKNLLTSVAEWIEEHKTWGSLAFFLIYLISCVLLIPASIMTLLAGFAFGPLLGLMVTWPSSLLGACISFALGRYFFKKRVRKYVFDHPKLLAIDNSIHQNGGKLILLLRLSPIFPYHILNYALSLTPVSLRTFALATGVGILPITILYLYLGSIAKNMNELKALNWSKEHPYLYGFYLIAILLGLGTIFYATKLAIRALKQAGLKNDK